MNETEMLTVAVKRFDDALAALRAIVVDPDYLNVRDGKEAKYAHQELSYALFSVERIKGAIAEANRLKQLQANATKTK